MPADTQIIISARDEATVTLQKVSQSVRDMNAEVARGGSALALSLSSTVNQAKASAVMFDTAKRSAVTFGSEIGVSAKQYADLHERMAKRVAADGMVRSLREIGDLAGLSTRQLRALGKELGATKEVLGRLGEGTGGFSSLLTTVGTAAVISLAVGKAVQIAKESFTIAMERESLTQAFANVSGSASAGASNLGFIRSEAERLGLAFDSAAQSAKSFFAATRGTEIAGNAQMIFSSMSEAISAMKLSEQDASRVFLALGQMASKGKVQAEELRKQLGEALPGAFQKMAQGLGVSTRELDKMLEDGRVGLDALVKMAEQFHLEFGGKAEAASRSMAGELARLKTSWNDLLAGMADTEFAARQIRLLTGLVKGLGDAMKPQTMDERLAAAEADLSRKQAVAAKPTLYFDARHEASKAWEVELARAKVVHLRELRAEAEEELKSSALMDAYRSAKEQDEAFRTRALGNARTYAKGLPSEQLKTAKAEYDQLQADLKASRERGLIDEMEYATRSGQVEQAYNQKIESIQKSANAASEKIAEALAKVRKEYTALFGSEQEKRAADWAEKYRDLVKSGVSPNNPDLQSLDQSMQLRIKHTLSPDQITGLSSIKDGWQMRDEGAKDAAKRAEKFYEEDLKLQTEFAEKHRAVVLDETAFKLAQIEDQAKAYTRAGAESVAVEQWAAAERLKVSRDWTDGARRGLMEYADTAKDASKGVERVVTGAAKGMEDALVTAFTTGKFEFASMADSIIADMARMAIQKSVTGPLASAASSAMGGIGGWLSGLIPGLHSGGIAGSESTFTRAVPMAVFAGAPRYHTGGIAGDEVPAILRRGEGVFTREQMAALGGGGGSTVIVNIENTTGAPVSQSESRGPNGERVISVLVGQEVNRQIRAGAFDRSMKDTYGVRRNGSFN